MDDMQFSLPGTRVFSIPADALDRLLRETDGCICLVYLYILKSGGTIKPMEAARELKLTAGEVEAATSKLLEMGLILPLRERGLAEARELPEYDALDLVDRGGTDAGFRVVLAETQRVFGRMLSTQELKQLFGIYDHLGFPAEVMLMLINHCVEEHRDKFGGEKLPPLRRIEREGFIWADNEILTLEQAEQYIKRRRETGALMEKLRRALGLGGRKLSSSEQKYAESWLDMGFSVEALEIAYDRTVVKTGALKWGYMNSIVKNWHEKNLHSPQEIELGDSPRGGALKQENGPADAPKHGELERMKKILDKISK